MFFMPTSLRVFPEYFHSLGGKETRVSLSPAFPGPVDRGSSLRRQARYDSAVRSWKWIQSGWLEATVGLALATLSIGSADRFPWQSTFADLLAFVAILLSLRWLRLGVAMALVVTLVVPFLDPDFFGLSLYLCMIPVVTAIRRDQFPMAIILSIASFGMGLWASLRPFESDQVTEEVGFTVLAWLALAAIVWGAGLGIRFAAHTAVDRVESRVRAQQTALAAELHSSVSRELGRLARLADRVRESGSAEATDLQEIADRARSADRALRQATWALAEGLDSGTGEDLNPDQALAHGLRELKRAGFSVEAIKQGECELGYETDLVAAKILAEALRNVQRHGDPSGPCTVVLEHTAESWELTVINQPRQQDPDHLAGVGISAMKARASAVGGRVEARLVKESWVCEAHLPKQLPHDSASAVAP